MRINLYEYGITRCGPEWEVCEKEGVVYHRLYYIYGGKVTYKGEDKQQLLQNKHLYFFPFQKPYLLTHDVDNPLYCLWFHVACFPPILNKFIDLEVVENSTLYYLIKVIESLAEDENNVNPADYKSESKEKNEDNVKTSSNNLLIELLKDLFICFDQEIGLIFVNDERIKKALDYIHNYYQQQLTNLQLSKVVGLNHYYFIRLFKKVMGMTPGQYITNYRLSKARFLLLEGITVKEVAREVGYADAKAFSRFFKKNQGIPPSHYQKSHHLQP